VIPNDIAEPGARGADYPGTATNMSDDGVRVGALDSAFDIFGSSGLPNWLAEHQLSLAFTTYQAGKLFLVGRNPDSGLSVFQRTFARCMGLWSAPDGQSMWMGSQFQLWRFANALTPGQGHDGYDRVYVPRSGHTTGDLDAHDLSVDSEGNVVFVNTKFGCLATLSDSHSFRALWRPPFISQLVAEDRCHLNGLAMVDGRPRYVSAVSRSDVVDGWRDFRRDGGVIVDVDSDEIVATGMSMPHSPRFYHDRLWVLNAGSGHFGYVDTDAGCFVPVTFVPGFARGLTFVGDYAIIGVSDARSEHTFDGLDLQEQLAKRHAKAQCGLQVIDLRTGTVVEWLRLKGAVRELYDVAVLPETVRPMVLGFQTAEIQTLLSIDPR